MPRVCVVRECGSRTKTTPERNFYFFPRVKDRWGRIIERNFKKRALWIAALQRDDFREEQLRYSYICSRHFVTGKPSDDPNDQDYIPSLDMGYTKHFAQAERVLKTEETTPLNETPVPIKTETPEVLFIKFEMSDEETAAVFDSLCSSQICLPPCWSKILPINDKKCVVFANFVMNSNSKMTVYKEVRVQKSGIASYHCYGNILKYDGFEEVITNIDMLEDIIKKFDKFKMYQVGKHGNRATEHQKLDQR